MVEQIEARTAAPDETLAKQWVNLDLQERDIKIEKHRLELELRLRMHERKAEVWEIGGADLEYRPANEYDQGILAGLAEHMPPADFNAMLRAPVEPKVDVRRAQAWAKKGEPYKSIVERSKKIGPPEFKIKRAG